METTSKYWDCECKENYIHPEGRTVCAICGAQKEEQPDSRVDEVAKMQMENIIFVREEAKIALDRMINTLVELDEKKECFNVDEQGRIQCIFVAIGHLMDSLMDTPDSAVITRQEIFNIRINEEMYGVEANIIPIRVGHTKVEYKLASTFLAYKFKPKTYNLLNRELKSNPELANRFTDGYSITLHY